MERKGRDQLNREIVLNDSPVRIVSLVPSQTELLFDLGLGDRVVGITRFCIHPKDWYRSKVRVGGTKTVHIDRVRSLNPDLIIANKEENTKSDIEALAEIAPVWISDIVTLEDALDMITRIGELTDSLPRALEIANGIRSGFEHLRNCMQPKRVLYLIWENPMMAAGQGTFIHSVIEHLGWKNVLAEEPRYPELTEEDLPFLQPELILLSSEPFPFKQKHLVYYKQRYPRAEIRIVNGELFSWYGSRLLHTSVYFLSSEFDGFRVKS
jgi:ABC-type Fe3+-hydroxamate transport system substrate-binding protein